MNNSSTRVSIPLYHGVKGPLLHSTWTQRGDELNKQIHWVVPLEVQWPDAWGIFNVRMVPSMHAYTGEFQFEIWDRVQLPKPKLIGRVTINSEDDTYAVHLEPGFYHYRLTAMLILLHSPQEPHENLAYITRTPNSDWHNKDEI